MVKVSRKEVEELLKMGVNHGSDGISRTHGHHHVHYYLCESKFNMSALNEIRNGKKNRK